MDPCKETRVLAGIFLCLRFADVLFETPAAPGKPAHSPISRDATDQQLAEHLEKLAQEEGRGSNNKVSNSIRLANNKLVSLHLLDRVSVSLLSSPGRLM